MPWGRPLPSLRADKLEEIRTREKARWRVLAAGVAVVVLAVAVGNGGDVEGQGNGCDAEGLSEVVVFRCSDDGVGDGC